LSEEIVKEDETDETISPIEVTIKKEEIKEPPSFDYDDYLPTPEEIEATEKEIDEIHEKRKVRNN